VYQRDSSFRLDIALPALAAANVRHTDDGQLETKDFFHDYEWVMLAGLWSTADLAPLYPEERSHEVLGCLKGYLGLLEQFPLDRQLTFRMEETKFILFDMVRSEWLENTPAIQAQVWDLMAAHPNPLVRAQGELSRLVHLQVAAGKLAGPPVGRTLNGIQYHHANRVVGGGGWAPVSQAYRLYLQACLSETASSTNRIARRLVYEASSGYLAGPDQVSLCDFMLQRGDVAPVVFDGAVAGLVSQTNQESVQAAFSDYERALSILDKSPDNYLGGGDAATYRRGLEQQYSDARKKAGGWREPEPPAPPPAWSEARPLLDLAGAKQGLTQVFRPVVQGDMVFAAGSGSDAPGGSFLQLLQIPLQQGAFKALAKIAVTNVTPRVACVDQEHYYLGTDQGIYIFPLQGGPVEVINHENGLPSDEVTALDCLEGKLYIGLGESGYLVSYDLTGRKCDILCSPRRREQRSPFDNGSPLGLPILVADAPRHRIVFLVDQGGGGGNWGGDLKRAQTNRADVFPMMCAQARAGMWSYLPATHEFKCLLPRHPNAQMNDATWIGRVSDSQIMLAASWGGGVAWFDFTTDQATLLYGKCYTLGLEDGMESMIQSRKMIVNPAFHCPPMLDHSLNLNAATFIAGDWIWAAGRHDEPVFSRVSLKSGRVDHPPSLRPSQPAFNPSECFRLVGKEQALMGDPQGLWLVTLTTADPQPKTAQR
jgi:hypothetical protein